MIFAKTLPLVLSGRKTQTMRLAYPGDALVPYCRMARGVPTWAVVEAPFTMGGKLIRRPRWIVGHTYAVQPERCRPAQGRILCTYLREVPDPLGVDDEFIHAEGFDTAGEFFRVWKELHPTNPVQRCWAIGFRLVRAAMEGGQG